MTPSDRSQIVNDFFKSGIESSNLRQERITREFSKSSDHILLSNYNIAGVQRINEFGLNNVNLNEIQGDSTIINLNNLKSFEISNCTFNTLILTGKCQNIYIKNSCIKNLYSTDLDSNTYILDGYERINPEGYSINQINFTLTNINTCKLKGFIKTIFINKNNSPSHTNTFGNLEILVEDIRNIYLYHTSFNLIELQRERKTGTPVHLEINDCKANSLWIKRLSLQNLEISDFQVIRKSRSILKFEETHISVLILKNSFLDKFDKFIFNKTNIPELISSNSSIPTTNITGAPLLIYENYIRFYTNSLNQNDKNTTSEYYKAAKSALLIHSFKNLNHKFNSFVSLGVSYLFSNFGTSWVQAIAITLSLSYILFNLMITRIHYPMNNDTNLFFTLFFQFVDPLHKLDFIDTADEKYSEYLTVIVINYLNKIILAIGIYETIRAFRKFVK